MSSEDETQPMRYEPVKPNPGIDPTYGGMETDLSDFALWMIRIVATLFAILVVVFFASLLIQCIILIWEGEFSWLESVKTTKSVK